MMIFNRSCLSTIMGTGIAIACGTVFVACTPRVEVAAPEKPITINLNVKIDHEIRVKVEKDLESVFADNSELF